jgi:hypothetical protein
MSLFRIAIVLSLGVAVMPSDKAQQEQLYERAASAAHWTATYCDRNGPTCETAGEVWDAFLRKAEFAGKLAYDVAMRYTADEAHGLFPTPTSAKGTLQPNDLRPDWRSERREGGV